MRLLAFGLLTVGTLFVIVDPVAAVPAFLSMTMNETAEHRIRTAALACWMAAGVLLVFAILDSSIFGCWASRCPPSNWPRV